jgi:serine/threonine protein phosphatase PrpC
MPRAMRKTAMADKSQKKRRRLKAPVLSDAIVYQITAASDIGYRSTNDDAYGIILNGRLLNDGPDFSGEMAVSGDDLLCLLIADGIGGLPRGRECADACVRAIAENFSMIRHVNDIDGWARVLKKAEGDILALFPKRAEKGGTTLNVLVLNARGEYFALNIGDSLTIRMNKTKSKILSEEQTLGMLKKLRGDTDVPEHEFGVLMDYLGENNGSPIKHAHVNFGKTSDSSFLLATDGVLEKHSIESVYSLYQKKKLSGASLVKSYRRHSKDNVTAISVIRKSMDVKKGAAENELPDLDIGSLLRRPAGRIPTEGRKETLDALQEEFKETGRKIRTFEGRSSKQKENAAELVRIIRKES